MNRIFLCLVLMYALDVYAQEKDKQIHITQDQIDKLAIQLGDLTVSQQVPLLYAPAKVVVPANHERLVSSTQPGLVVQLYANIGDHIEKNQVLARINSPDLLNLQHNFLIAVNELSLSDLEFARDSKLLSEGVIAERRWQETKMLHEGKLAQYHSNRQLLEIVGMTDNEIDQLAKTRKFNSLLNIHSPISGVVLDRIATLGSRLDMQSPLYQLADLSELWLEINIPQERLSLVSIGDKVQIEESPITAKISLLGQNVNRENQTVLARAIIEKNAKQLRVGQNVNVQIMQNQQQAGFKVLNTAISQNDGHNYIFVRNADGFLVTEVNVIGKQDNESLITAKLSGHEHIATKGAVALKANWLGLGSEE